MSSSSLGNKNKLEHGKNSQTGGVSLGNYFNLPTAPSTSQPETKRQKISDPIDRTKPLVTVGNLTFQYFNKTVLRGINLDLMPGQRCLLIGANGAGKSTFLRVLAGKHMPPSTAVLSVLGTRAPQDQNGGLAYLGNNWSRVSLNFFCTSNNCILTCVLTFFFSLLDHLTNNHQNVIFSFRPLLLLLPM